MGLKCWQLYSSMMINMFCMDLRPHVRSFMRSRSSAKIYGVLLWACVCVFVDSRCQFLCSAHLAHCCCRRSVKRVPRLRAPVCRLSVWRWRHRGLSRKLGSEVGEERKRAWDPTVRPCIHPHSRPNRRPGAGESRKGWVGGWVESG